MNNIITTTNLETITSMEVAQMIEKDHAKLLRDIHRYINQIEKINETKIGQSKIGFTDFFIESTYITSQNKIQPCYNITHKGCEFIANKLTGIKGTEFTARYVNRFHELEEGNTINSLISTMKTISDTMLEIQKSTNERLDKLENSLQDSQSVKPNLPKKKWSYWASKMYPKYQLLTDYFHISNTELYKNLYRELQNTYPDIDLNQEIDDYCYENKFESAYTLDVIEHNLMLRKAYEHIVDTLLDKYNLSDENYETRYTTIFDDIPA